MKKKAVEMVIASREEELDNIQAGQERTIAYLGAIPRFVRTPDEQLQLKNAIALKQQMLARSNELALLVQAILR